MIPEIIMLDNTDIWRRAYQQYYTILKGLDDPRVMLPNVLSASLIESYHLVYDSMDSRLDVYWHNIVHYTDLSSLGIYRFIVYREDLMLYLDEAFRELALALWNRMRDYDLFSVDRVYYVKVIQSGFYVLESTRASDMPTVTASY